jgi:putative ABC transport system substrate-binding protein
VRRWDFITLFVGAAGASMLWPPTLAAQQGTRRIGVLMGVAEGDPEGQARLTAFRQGLQALGWTEGRNVQLDLRWAAGDAERTRAHTAELVGLAPDVILANGTQVVRVLQERTRSIPIVFALVTDPVGEGLVESLARPGGNVTGFASFEYPLSGKWLEVLKEIAPRVGRVMLINHWENIPGAGYLPALERAVPAAGVKLSVAQVRDSAEIERALDAFAREPDGGLIVLPSPLTLVNRERIVALAARHRLPAIYAFRYFAAAGGLASYGIDSIDVFRRSASYVDRILKGAKPGDLPVQHPTKFDLAINLKTAKALGLTIPESFLLRADQVIE